MKAFTGAVWIGLAICVGGVPLLAQMQDNSEKQLSCNNGGYDSDRARHCDIREQSLPSIGRINVDSSPNGAVSIKGWMRSDVLLRTRVEASGDTEGAAAALASQVTIDASGGQVRAMGPESRNNSGWSVSYEVFVPQVTDVTLKTTNGALSISDVRGQIHFDVVNGAVHLKRVAGDISGGTVNGAIQADLIGNIFDGRQMELSTKNGAVQVTVPANYSAHVQAETGMGRIQSDFPVGAVPSVEERARQRKIDFNIGSGGPLIHITTGNGSVRLKKAEM